MRVTAYLGMLYIVTSSGVCFMIIASFTVVLNSLVGCTFCCCINTTLLNYHWLVKNLPTILVSVQASQFQALCIESANCCQDSPWCHEVKLLFKLLLGHQEKYLTLIESEGSINEHNQIGNKICCCDRCSITNAAVACWNY